jgi:hypothetical protein
MWCDLSLTKVSLKKRHGLCKKKEEAKNTMLKE